MRTLNNTRHIASQFKYFRVRLFQPALILCYFFCTPLWLRAQDLAAPTQNAALDTLPIEQDSVRTDSIRFNPANHKSSLDEEVKYEARDSIVMDLPKKKAYLYGLARIDYQNVVLKAEYIEVDFDAKEVYAKGLFSDSTGKYYGRPQFEDAGKVYEADTMRYNFESKKGLSYGVLTTEQDGYIHGEKVLRDSFENIYVKHAYFTTCNLPQPHFEIRADKIKLVPRKQIITGPANLVIQGVRTPLAVPFGFFPIPEKRKHGILFPSFGNSNESGYNLRGLGYYVPVSPFMDLQVQGDIYFRGRWQASVSSNYYKRYKYRGNVRLSVANNPSGEPETPEYRNSNQYNVIWSFVRDAKAKPGSSFGAYVNFATSDYLKNNSTNFQDLVSTTSNSSINYSKRLLKNKLTLASTANIRQDFTSGSVNLTLPELTASLSRQMPFSKVKVNKSDMVESFVRNLGFNYTGSFRNQVITRDSLMIDGFEDLFRSGKIGVGSFFNDFKNGVSHSLPVATSFKLLKWVTVSPNFNYNEYWYFNTLNKSWDPTGDSVIESEVSGFERVNRYNFSATLSTIIYGTKVFADTSRRLKAIRHVIRPNIGGEYNPDFNQGAKYGYRSYVDSAGKTITYNIFEQGIVQRATGGPRAAINFGFGNNLELKTRKRTDSSFVDKKVKLIESLNINSSYNFLADSNKLAVIRISGITTLFDRVRVNLGGTVDPYKYYENSLGKVYQSADYRFKVDRKLGSLTDASLVMSTDLNPDAFKRKESSSVDQRELEYINTHRYQYIDFNMPWRLAFNYSLRYSNPVIGKPILSQNLTVNGDLKLTENWMLTVSSGYDFKNQSLGYTAITINRDLHCWQMNFSWYPIQRPMFEFSIAVKSSTLQDLKLNRRRSWFDFQ